MNNSPIKIAVLDDYQQVAFKFADWSAIESKSEVTVFTDHIADEAKVIERLLPFEVICAMRERTPLKQNILSKLPNLKLIVSTGMRNASIDTKAAEELGIAIKFTRYVESGAPEHTWALIMAMARHIPTEVNNFKTNGWQTTIGSDFKGKTIGILGLGRVGSKIAAYAKAFDMNVIAWSPNLTEDRAKEAGTSLVSKEDLFKQADIVTIHMVLSDKTRGMVGKPELELMKPTAYFVNTSRGSLADEAAIIEVLQQNKIAGAILDVFDQEPLTIDHPFRTMKNVLATPHIGYVTKEIYSVFYTDTVKAVEEWLT